MAKMPKFDHIDDQMLGAFVDGQLDAASREAVIRAMENDPKVRDSVYRLRRAKDLMTLGFNDAHAPSRDLRTTKTSIWRRYALGVAASIAILVVSFAFGTLGYHYRGQVGGHSSPAAASMAQDQTERVILHISESDPKQFSIALAYVEKFLQEHKERNGEIAVIANAGGIDLMRVGVSPMEDRVVAMMRRYDNVYFIACANAIRSLRKKGIEPDIIENIPTHKPAMDHIIERVQAGWTYVKVSSLTES